MDQLIILASKIGDFLKQKHYMLATAESCTGGGVAQAITAVAGSSQWFERGFVSYSNQAKQDLLDVKKTTLEQYGAVSEETVIQMAEGALKHSTADLSLAITGIAGPEGGTKEKPVGLVWFGWAHHHHPTMVQQVIFQGDRNTIRQEAVKYALTGTLQLKF